MDELEQLKARVDKIEAMLGDAAALAPTLRKIAKHLGQGRASICLIRRTPSGRPAIVTFAIDTTALDHPKAGTLIYEALQLQWASFLRDNGEGQTAGD